MNVAELASIAAAMGISPEEYDIDGDGSVDKAELIAAITQSETWPTGNEDGEGITVAGLSLCSYEKLMNDDDPAVWAAISWWSPLFVLDVPTNTPIGQSVWTAVQFRRSDLSLGFTYVFTV